jgi:hypothetical protein
VNAEPAASLHPLQVGAFAELQGLVGGDNPNEDGVDRSPDNYNHCQGVLLGYDKSSGRWEIKIMGEEEDDERADVVLSVHPSNVCVEEPAAQRDASGHIILKRNEGGFAEQTHWPNVEANERREREGWKPNGHDPHPPEGSPSTLPWEWTSEEDDAIYGALVRLANSVAPEERGRLGALSYDFDGWPSDLVCGQGRYCGPHYGCNFPAIYGRKRDQCLCEFCFCGYIYKGECYCSAMCWALCSTQGWDELIRTVHLPATRRAVAQAATRVVPH